MKQGLPSITTVVVTYGKHRKVILYKPSQKHNRSKKITTSLDNKVLS